MYIVVFNFNILCVKSEELFAILVNILLKYGYYHEKIEHHTCVFTLIMLKYRE